MWFEAQRDSWNEGFDLEVIDTSIFLEAEKEESSKENEWYDGFSAQSATGPSPVPLLEG